MVEIKKILFPSDLGENSPKFLPYVLSLADKYESEIYFLHVVEDLSKWGGFYIPHLSLEQFQREGLEAAKKFMDRVCDEKMKGCTNFQRRVLVGDPAEEILKVIESEEIDLVIMGTHGRKRLEHVIFGSVAENVVKKSPVPVLTINPFKL